MSRPCVICGCPKAVRSHLLPRAIFLDQKSDSKKVWVGSFQKPGKEFTQAGIFDYFLCQKHESAFHGSEYYAIEFIRKFSLSDEERQRQFFIRSDVNNEALIRFVCSVLWRCHCSTRKEVDSIDLQEWEPRIQEVTFGGDIRLAPDIYIMTYDDISKGKDGKIFFPHPSVELDRNVIQFIIFGIIFTAKLDNRKYLPIMWPALLASSNNRLRGFIKKWGEYERNMMRQGLKMVGLPIPGLILQAEAKDDSA